jgi:lipoprotein-anchoring transpeptidase ErfK/SrfK
MRLGFLACTFAIAASACASPDDGIAIDDPEEGSYEGVDYDAEHPGAPLDDDKSDAPRYAIPTDLPQLVAPEIIVSLDGLTVHLFDRATGFSAVYPTGVGVKNSKGRSITPTGHFATGADTSDSWWYVSRRTVPEHFGGFPFLRLTVENSEGANTYALHGPITAVLQRGYVSHGCMRMKGNDIVRLFWMVKQHADTPVTIQREVELDAAGNRVDVGRTPVLWAVGEEIDYGASVGPRL